MHKNRTGSWRRVRPIAHRPRDHEDGASLVIHGRGIPPTPMLLIAAANTLLARWMGADSAAFVNEAGSRSHYDNAAQASSWPLPDASDCVELGKFAGDHDILVEGPPCEGDLFLLWSPARKAFTRTGIVVRLLRNESQGGEWHYYMNGRGYYRCLVLEGASSANGMVGENALEMVRNLCPADGDRFVRWTRLDARELRRGIEMARGMADRAVKDTLDAERGFIRRAARSISRHNRALAEDLGQEAKVAIWQLDPTRFDLTKPAERTFVRRAVIHRMLNAMKKWMRGLRRASSGGELREEEAAAMWRSAGPRDAALRTQQQEEGIRGLGLITDVEQS